MVRINAQSISAGLDNFFVRRQKADKTNVTCTMSTLHAHITILITKHYPTAPRIGYLALPQPAIAISRLNCLCL